MDITDIMDMGMAAVGTTGTFMENKSFKTYEFKDTAIIPDRKLTWDMVKKFRKLDEYLVKEIWS